MNVANLKASNEFALLALKQGWTHDTQFAIICDFITLKGLWPDVLAYAKKECAQEGDPQ